MALDSQVTEGTTYKRYAAAEQTKLAGVAAGAGTSLVLVAYDADTTVVGNSATRNTAVGEGWNTGAYSRDKHTGTAYCAFRAVNSPILMAGLCATFTGSYASLDYAWDFGGAPGAAGVGIRQLGTEVGSIAAGSWAETDVFAVVYDGVKVRYLQNGVVRYTSTVAAGQTLGFAVSISTNAKSVTDVQFGPAHQAARITDIYTTAGTSQYGQAQLVTGEGVAADFAGSGDLAFLNSVALDSQVTEGTTYKRYAATEQTKLAGVETGATAGAAWGTNLTGRPTELTDGRVSAGFDSVGDLARNVKTNKVVTDSVLLGALLKSASHKSTATTIDVVNGNATAPADRVLAKSYTFTVDHADSIVAVSFLTQVILGNGNTVYFYLRIDGETTATWDKVSGRGVMTNADDVSRVQLSANDNISHSAGHDYEGLSVGSHTITMYVNMGGDPGGTDLYEPYFKVDEHKRPA